MNRPLVLATALVVAAGLAGPASAASKPKPKPFKGSQKFTDNTPDPSASVPRSREGCDSALPAQYPREKGITVDIKWPGRFKVLLDNKADWAVDLLSSKGTVVSSADGEDPNTVEMISTRITKAGKYTIVPCNLTGEPTVNVSWSYTP
ncbi:MAG TPA: hypothetical protein VFQ85_01510 [Mycobacteriales bacterium]|jgi:hypothetical protein|nr:hypothetical protein [Mycobacteriales bacterium]